MSTIALLCVALVSLLLTASLLLALRKGASPKKTGAASAHAFHFRTKNGADLPLSQFQGQVVLVVNTASRCGFTPQYESMQALHARYGHRGFSVLAVPSNDFGAQEPGTDEEIERFVCDTFHASFPIAAKETVMGEEAHPFFRWAGERFGLLASPKWNFYKYLIGPNGEPLAWYSSKTAPDDAKLTAEIEKHLPR